MSFKFDPKKQYFMPVWFNGENCDGINDLAFHKPADVDVISVTYETDREYLESLIPDCFTLLEPYVNVKFCQFYNLSWMWGKGYILININCPVHYKGEKDEMDGDLILCMFENHPDPIISGRDSMGYAKYFCEIPMTGNNDGVFYSQASAWGNPFCKISVNTNEKPSDADIEEVKRVESRPKGKFQFKYIPQTRDKDEPYEANYTRPDCAYPTVLPNFVKPEGYPYQLGITENEWGTGSIEWTALTKEEWPMGFRIADGLAGLKVNRVLAARHFVYKEPGVYYTCYRLR